MIIRRALALALALMLCILAGPGSGAGIIRASAGDIDDGADPAAVPALPPTGGRWYGRTMVIFGDSRTWYHGNPYGLLTKPELAGKPCVGFQQILGDLTGLNIISEGGSGETSVDICARIRGYDFTGIDATLLEGGVNDFIRGCEPGSLAAIGSAFDTETVYGAWQSAVESVMANYPQVRIYLTVPAIAWSGDAVFPYDIARVKRDVAGLYHIPCVDLYEEAGITALNRDDYYADDIALTGWRLHFNDRGNALIGGIIAHFIETH